jgi:hypothetical protein
MKNLSILLSFFIVIFTSCTNEEFQSEGSIPSSSDILNGDKIRQNPKILNSVKYQKIDAINEVTKVKGVFYFEKSKFSTFKVIVSKGLWYSGGDCATWGTIYRDDVSGDSFFVPGSAVTQSLLNVCGLSNLCKNKY